MSSDLGSGAEFDAIRALLARWGDLAQGIGDDAAVFSAPEGEQLVVSTDSSHELVHFRTEWLSPAEIGGRATAAALSDLAAMGARALSVLLSLQVPPAWRERLPELADGIGGVVRDAGARIIGGNLSAGDRLGITLTVIGSTASPVPRSGARPGDALWVTGALGGPLRALQAWQGGTEPAPHDRARFAAPTPRLREGEWLAAHGAHAMIDVSDGLAADAGHLAAASGVVCELWPDVLPRWPGASVLDALSSGEEYELLVATAPALRADEFERQLSLPLTRVGVVRALEAGQTAGVVLADGVSRDERHGAAGPGETKAALRVDLPAGHDHFSA